MAKPPQKREMVTGLAFGLVTGLAFSIMGTSSAAGVTAPSLNFSIASNSMYAPSIVM